MLKKMYPPFYSRLFQYKLGEEIYFSGLHAKHQRFQLQSVAFNDFPGDLGWNMAVQHGEYECSLSR